jgi:hypothetical protein
MAPKNASIDRAAHLAERVRGNCQARPWQTPLIQTRAAALLHAPVQTARDQAKEAKHLDRFLRPCDGVEFVSLRVPQPNHRPLSHEAKAALNICSGRCRQVGQYEQLILFIAGSKATFCIALRSK